MHICIPHTSYEPRWSAATQHHGVPDWAWDQAQCSSGASDALRGLGPCKVYVYGTYICMNVYAYMCLIYIYIYMCVCLFFLLLFVAIDCCLLLFNVTCCHFVVFVTLCRALFVAICCNSFVVVSIRHYFRYTRLPSAET